MVMGANMSVDGSACSQINTQIHDLSALIDQAHATLIEKISNVNHRLEQPFKSIPNATTDLFKILMVDVDSGEELGSIIQRIFDPRISLTQLERLLTVFFLSCRAYSNDPSSRDHLLSEICLSLHKHDTISLHTTLSNLFNTHTRQALNEGHLSAREPLPQHLIDKARTVKVVLRDCSSDL